jgi:hypothetical protein
VGSNPASRTNKIKDLRQKWRESFFFLRDFCATWFFTKGSWVIAARHYSANDRRPKYSGVKYTSWAPSARQANLSSTESCRAPWF